MHQKIKGDFEQQAFARKDQAILRHDQFKRPGIVGHSLRQLGHVLAKPLAAPRPRLEPGTHAKEAVRQPVKSAAQRVAACKGDGVGALAVDDPVDVRMQRQFVPIGRHPVHKVAALVGRLGVERLRGAQTGHAAGALAELDLVLGDIDVDQRGLPAAQRRAAAVEDGERRVQVGLQRAQRIQVEEIRQLAGKAEAKDRVVAAQVRGDQRVDGRGRLQRRGDIDPVRAHAERVQRGIEALAEVRPDHAGIAVDHDLAGAGQPLRQCSEARLDLT